MRNPENVAGARHLLDGYETTSNRKKTSDNLIGNPSPSFINPHIRNKHGEILNNPIYAMLLKQALMGDD